MPYRPGMNRPDGAGEKKTALEKQIARGKAREEKVEGASMPSPISPSQPESTETPPITGQLPGDVRREQRRAEDTIPEDVKKQLESTEGTPMPSPIAGPSPEEGLTEEEWKDVIRESRIPTDVPREHISFEQQFPGRYRAREKIRETETYDLRGRAEELSETAPGLEARTKEYEEKKQSFETDVEAFEEKKGDIKETHARIISNYKLGRITAEEAQESLSQLNKRAESLESQRQELMGREESLEEQYGELSFDIEQYEKKRGVWKGMKESKEALGETRREEAYTPGLSEFGDVGMAAGKMVSGVFIRLPTKAAEWVGVPTGTVGEFSEATGQIGGTLPSESPLETERFEGTSPPSPTGFIAGVAKEGVTGGPRTEATEMAAEYYSEREHIPVLVAGALGEIFAFDVATAPVRARVAPKISGIKSGLSSRVSKILETGEVRAPTATRALRSLTAGVKRAPTLPIEAGRKVGRGVIKVERKVGTWAGRKMGDIGKRLTRTSEWVPDEELYAYRTVRTGTGGTYRFGKALRDIGSKIERGTIAVTERQSLALDDFHEFVYKTIGKKPVRKFRVTERSGGMGGIEIGGQKQTFRSATRKYAPESDITWMSYSQAQKAIRGTKAVIKTVDEGVGTGGGISSSYIKIPYKEFGKYPRIWEAGGRVITRPTGKPGVARVGYAYAKQAAGTLPEGELFAAEIKNLPVMSGGLQRLGAVDTAKLLRSSTGGVLPRTGSAAVAADLSPLSGLSAPAVGVAPSPISPTVAVETPSAVITEGVEVVGPDVGGTLNSFQGTLHPPTRLMGVEEDIGGEDYEERYEERGVVGGLEDVSTGTGVTETFDISLDTKTVEGVLPVGDFQSTIQDVGPIMTTGETGGIEGTGGMGGFLPFLPGGGSGRGGTRGRRKSRLFGHYKKKVGLTSPLKLMFGTGEGESKNPFESGNSIKSVFGG